MQALKPFDGAQAHARPFGKLRLRKPLFFATSSYTMSNVSQNFAW